jgi:phage terminase large subunit-like protein
MPELAEIGGDRLGSAAIGSELPRLRTVVPGGNSYGPLVVEWAEREFQLKLMPWQRLVLNDIFTVGPDGRFVFRTALCSVGRQNGKTTLLEAAIGWLLIEFPKIEKRKINILSTAHQLDLAVESFNAIADTLEERFGCKAIRAYGRNQITTPGGSMWKVQAATGKRHGGTWDVIFCDELFAISEAVIFGALRPSQIAVPNPIMIMFSTAGDESSTVFLQLREQALAAIDKSKASDLYFAEWSVPPGVDAGDESQWPLANPALGTTITIEGLRSAYKAPDRVQFMRAHLNQWVSAAGSWLPPGLWASLETSIEMPPGGVLSIETSLDEQRFVGVRAANDGDRVHVCVEFIVGTMREMWAEVERIMKDHRVTLTITPSFEIHLPAYTNKRYTLVGYNELLKHTGLVRSMINEERILHRGETILSEHVCRAVLAKTVQGVVLSSNKSPGPIELARCLVWAAALVSKPQRATRPLIAVAGR